jgi:death-on-curing protein
MINEFGGHLGFERGIEAYDVVVKEVKRTHGRLYRKAAVFLKLMVNARIFGDGNHRTAFAATDVFLRMNGAEIKTANQQEIIRFIKDIKTYTIEDIEVWLRNGKVL